MSLIRDIEECSLNAWPALQQMVLDGWLLRFAGGHTRRANSITPLYPGVHEVRRKVAECERIYRARHLPCLFRITPLAHPPDLDETLAWLGYHQQAPTSVQVLDPWPADLAPADPVQLAEDWRNDSGGKGWLAAYVRINNVPEANAAVLREILSNIPSRSCYATLRQGRRIVACGLGVLQGENFGLFDIGTLPSARGRGHAGRVIRALLSWARSQGAQRAYLQVMLDNTPALGLYGQLGFHELYRYWYRVNPLDARDGPPFPQRRVRPVP